MFAALKRAAAGALFCFAGAAFAQASALSGTVTSQAEGAMEGVIVGAKRAGSTMTVSVVSDKQGRYAFPADRLEPGNYTLRVRDLATGHDLPLAIDVVASYVDAGVAAGATLVVDGRNPDVDGESGGFWLGPTLFDNVTTDMSIYTDEIFGPVLSVVRIKSYDEGLKLINDHEYGNGTAIFTNDGGAARRFQNEVKVGMIGINVPIPVPVAYYSFGGWKASLFGDTHAHGVEGVHFFTRGKVVTSRWLDPSHGGINLGFPTQN